MSSDLRNSITHIFDNSLSLWLPLWFVFWGILFNYFLQKAKWIGLKFNPFITENGCIIDGGSYHNYLTHIRSESQSNLASCCCILNLCVVDLAPPTTTPFDWWTLIIHQVMKNWNIINSSMENVADTLMQLFSRLSLFFLSVFAITVASRRVVQQEKDTAHEKSDSKSATPIFVSHASFPLSHPNLDMVSCFIIPSRWFWYVTRSFLFLWLHSVHL